MSARRWDPRLAAIAASAWRTAAERAAGVASRAFGVPVPVDLVLAIVGAESFGDPRAVGDNGDSRGLMQVRSATARELGFPDPMRLHVPAVGLEAGSRYLARQLSRYRGDQARAIAAYNAGTAFTAKAGGFTNQGYVDKVRKVLAHLRPGSSAPAAAPVQRADGIILAFGLVAAVLAIATSREAARGSAAR